MTRLVNDEIQMSIDVDALRALNYELEKELKQFYARSNVLLDRYEREVASQAKLRVQRGLDGLENALWTTTQLLKEYERLTLARSAWREVASKEQIVKVSE